MEKDQEGGEEMEGAEIRGILPFPAQDAKSRNRGTHPPSALPRTLLVVGRVSQVLAGRGNINCLPQ